MGQTRIACRPDPATVAPAKWQAAAAGSGNAIAPGRLISLDVFRGATMAAMIVVNNPGNSSAYRILRHADWNGWTPTDLIFPFFLFIVGVSLALSSRSRLLKGDSRHHLLVHAVQRTVLLFGIGLLLNFSLPLSSWRIPGVLQRIALCYLAAAVITLYTSRRARIIWIAGLLLGYWAVIRFIPVPGYGVPGSEVPLLHPDGNLASWLDRLFVPGRLFEGTRDPEGILSTFPSIASVLVGVSVGDWLPAARTTPKQPAAMAFTGFLLLLAGEVWSLWFPINKKMWTSSYVLFSAGAALLCLAICYWLIDLRGWHAVWTKPFLIFGMNAITAYVFSELLGIVLWKTHVHYGRRLMSMQDFIYRQAFSAIQPKPIASLAYSLSFLVVCFLPLWWMFRKKIFLKV